MLVYNLTQILNARGIERPHHFLVKAGFSRHTASRLLSRECRNVFSWHVEKLCTILLCEPNDLFVWVPDKNVNYPENFPLKALQRKDMGEEFLPMVAGLTLEEFKELAKLVLERRKSGSE